MSGLANGSTGLAGLESNHANDGNQKDDVTSGGEPLCQFPIFKLLRQVRENWDADYTTVF